MWLVAWRHSPAEFVAREHSHLQTWLLAGVWSSAAVGCSRWSCQQALYRCPGARSCQLPRSTCPAATKPGPLLLALQYYVGSEMEAVATRFTLPARAVAFSPSGINLAASGDDEGEGPESAGRLPARAWGWLVASQMGVGWSPCCMGSLIAPPTTTESAAALLHGNQPAPCGRRSSCVPDLSSPPSRTQAPSSETRPAGRLVDCHLFPPTL